MAFDKELETKGAKKPILIKGTDHAVCLQLKIGGLKLEVWNSPNEDAEPYARLIFEVDWDGKVDGTCEERTEWPVTLDWRQAFAVSEAIVEWLRYLESDLDEYHEPALQMELGSLRFDFYRKDMSQGPRMTCTVDAESSLCRTVILSRSEASFLGRLLFGLGYGETEEEG